MRIEEGKCYRTRDGRKVGPIEPWPFTDDWKWQGTESGKKYGYLWDANGVNYDGAGSPHDLVAEWSESPIVTETVRRIKPGVYGRLWVGEDTTGYASVAFKPMLSHDDWSPEEGQARSLSAPELRELARVALEIAEYLENA